MTLFLSIGYLSGNFIVGLAAFVFLLLRAFYRLYFHPLARWNGSRIAAIDTAWYEFYWNVHLPGQLLFEIEKLHNIYGPVVRIGTNELHVNDPSVYLDITSVGSDFRKEPDFYHGISLEGTSIGGTDPEKHRVRRQVLAPAFSASTIQKLAPLVENSFKKLCEKMDSIASSVNAVNVKLAFKSFALDVVSEIVFGQAFGVMEEPNFHHPYLDSLQDTIRGAWIARAFPTLSTLSRSLPKSISAVLFPLPIAQFSKDNKALLDKYLKERRSAIQLADGNTQKTYGTRKKESVALELLLDIDSAKGHIVPPPDKLHDEAMMLLTAGNDTTSNAMILGLYEICKHQDVHRRLEDELRSAVPTPSQDIKYATVKKLPYLTAVIKEVLRYAPSVPGRLPRVVPEGGYELYGQQLPAGTIIHTSAYLLNRHPSIWGPDCKEFKPDRWLLPDSSTLDKYLASFHRGARQCLGISLAWCELYIVFATLFRKYEIEVFNTSDADMEWSDHLLLLFRGKDLRVKLERKKD